MNNIDNNEFENNDDYSTDWEINNLKILLEAARKKKGYSQRELAKKIGIHHSTINDIENGKIKKLSIELIGKLGDNLDLSLAEILKAAGYDFFVDTFKKVEVKEIKKPIKNLKKLVAEYRKSQTDLLEDAYQKRDNVRNCISKLDSIISKLSNYEYYKEIYPTDKLNEELKEIKNDLLKSAEKYDYNKLPYDNAKI